MYFIYIFNILIYSICISLCFLLLSGLFAVGVPYCEYFHVQTRWIVTRVEGGSVNRCRLQIGLDVVFRQSVMMKGVIRGGTEGETKRGLLDWLIKARQVVGAAASTADGAVTTTDAASSLQPSDGSSSVATLSATSSQLGDGGVSPCCHGCPFCEIRRAYHNSSLLVQAMAVLKMIVSGLVSIVSRVMNSLGTLTDREMLVVFLTLAILTIAWLLNSSVKHMLEMTQLMHDMQTEHLRLAQAHQ